MRHAENQELASRVVIVSAIEPANVAKGMLWLDTSAAAALPAYAGISVVGNAVETAIAGAGTAVQVTIFDTNSPANLLTPDHTNDHITIDKSGTFLVMVSATINSVVGAASRFDMTVQKNNGASNVGALYCDRNLGGGGSESGVISMSGIVTLAAADTLEVWIENQTNTQNYVVEDIDLSIMRLTS